ncbi:hypothetical protein IKW75_01680 [Candidatus Saccharibacteria bacterium]|nr:hypothetical protein [Candidatus Saccharibacteria bacterium]
MDFLKQLEKDYDEYVIQCRCAMRIALAEIENIKDQIDGNSPDDIKSNGSRVFDNIESRIKTFDSALEKCRRKNYNKVKRNLKKATELTKDDFDIDTIKSRMQDVAGIRITTVFLDDIYKIYEEIKKSNSLVVSHEDDYIVKPKKNGYRSLHIVLMVKISTKDGAKLIPVEVQIRDKAMDLWAAMDHVIRYKNPHPSPDAERRFLEIADTLQNFDRSVIELRDFDGDNLVTFSPKSPD